jgi:glyoxylase-like metal-dependent hydrolase (beta-lactamase superfamily II)
MTTTSENDAWRAVPGNSAARLMPLERPRSADCTIYLLEFPKLFLLVDLGMAEERLKTAIRAMNAADPGHAKPLLVVLTHCHIDHIAAAPALRGVPPRPFSVAGHSACRAVLARQDPTSTVSYLFRCVPPFIEITTPLFGNDRPATNRPLAGKGLCSLSLTDATIDPDLGLPVQDIMVAGRPICRVYATPGHSACSVSLQIGDILFCGDLPFAGHPGVAGIPGWNREDLLTSLDAMNSLIRRDNHQLVCSGHGPMADHAAALAQFDAARAQTHKIKARTILDAGRSAFLKKYAQVLLHEVSSAFTIIAGRLLIVAEQLERLEEHQRSQAIRDSDLMDKLDALIDRYARSAGREDRTEEPEMRLPLMAGAILAKLDRMLKDSFFTGIIDPVRLRRARNLILDFKNALLGITFRDLLRPEEPQRLVRALRDKLTATPYEDGDLLDAAEDHDAFMDEMVRRMAFRPLFRDVDFSLSVPDGLPPVAVVKGHLLDTLTGLCELLVVSGGDRIEIDATRIGEEVRLTLATAAPKGRHLMSENKVAFYSTTLQLYGARFAVHRDGERLTQEIHLPVAEWIDEPVI